MTAEQAEIEDRIRQATWRAGGTVGSASGPVKVGELRKYLAGRVLVTYGKLGDDLVAVVIGERGSSRLVGLGPAAAVRDQLRAFLFALRRLTEQHGARPLDAARASADLRIKNLSALLVEPLRITPWPELVVVPVPDLLGVPWSALYPGPVSLAPSATFWARSALAAQQKRAISPAGTAGRVALIAGPDLPGALAEVEAVAGVYPQALSLAPPDSTAERVTGALGVRRPGAPGLPWDAAGGQPDVLLTAAQRRAADRAGAVCAGSGAAPADPGLLRVRRPGLLRR